MAGTITYLAENTDGTEHPEGARSGRSIQPALELLAEQVHPVEGQQQQSSNTTLHGYAEYLFR